MTLPAFRLFLKLWYKIDMWIRIGLISSLLFVLSCQSQVRDLDKIKEKGELRVLTKNSPTTYYEDRDGQPSGLEYEMAKSFARHIGVKAKFIVVDSIEEIIEDLKLGKGDVAAAGLSKTEERESLFSFGPSYQSVQQTVICRDGVQPGNVEELKEYNLLVEAETSYEERLSNLKQQHPKLKWKTTSQSAPLIFEKMAAGKVDCTVADSHIVTIHRRYFPELELAMKLGDPQQLAWMMSDESEMLHKEVSLWFEESMTAAKRQRLIDKYYSHLEDFDPYDIRKFVERIESRLPKYRDHFIEAGKKYDWPWTFLAAMAYQESHWDEKAVSPTGVRGVMMLTQNTARSVGVKDRLDPKQSIFGGARYLSRLRKRIPNYIPNPDRIWLTLASYNVGYAHLRDARAVAIWKEFNPNRWFGIRQALPLLSQQKIYKRLPHGYARGLEPVLYVKRIRNYHDLLRRHLGR